MKLPITPVVETVFGLLLLVATVSVNAQTVGAGPYYASPSWDQTLPPNTRFIVLSNMNSAAVLDRETGLVWQKTPDQSHTLRLSEAQQTCFEFESVRYGWRVPTTSELLSLFVPGTCTTNAGVTVKCRSLPDGHPFDLPNGSVSAWSTTQVGGSPGSYFGLFTAPRGILTGIFDANTGQASAWCVRAPF